MNDCNSKLISLLTCAVRGEPGQDILTEPLSEEEVNELYELAKKHDLSHLVAVALETAEPNVKKQFKRFFDDSVKAAFRYEWLKREQKKIFALLEQHNISYIPLKGTVIRALYREPWYRTSSDIDILIPKECMDRALDAFMNELSYRRSDSTKWDVSLMAPSGVHFELHYGGGEEYVDCAEFWKDAQPVDSESCKYVLSAEMLMLTHIAHMAKHFTHGGCGLRPFLDLWLMKEKLNYDAKKLSEMLYSHNLTDFSNVIFGIVAVWFEQKKSTETEEMAQDFIFSGGVYGDLYNSISISRSDKNIFCYIVHRIFPPFSSLRDVYPFLSQQPWMYPICWVRRWIRLIRTGRLKMIKTEYNINRRLNEDELNSTGELLKRLGLNK